MKYFRIGFIIFGILAFLNMSINSYYGNYVRFYNADFSSLVIWIYFPLAFFSALKGWLAFSIFDLVLKMDIPKVDKNRYILLVTLCSIIISFFIEDFKNYDAILYNGWSGLLFYPSFLSSLFLIIYYLILKHKPKSSGNKEGHVDARNNLSIIR